MNLRRPLVPTLLLGMSSLLGCHAASDAPTPLPPLTSAPLATDRSLVLGHMMEVQTALNPSDVAGLTQLLADGWGATADAPGDVAAPHTLDGSPPPAPAASPALLVRFAHLTDTQLADDESPSRAVDFFTMGATFGSYRPQEAWGCRMLNAIVRTVNKVHETLPIEFVLLGGDNSDNAQTNEIEWFSSILDGAPRVKCDSGQPNDPVPGPNNDPKDAFIAEGLKMPWRWVTGNHDVLNQGNFALADRGGSYTITTSDFGTRDWSQPGAPTTHGPIVADPLRAPLDRMSLMAKIAADGDGHGLTAAVTSSGKANYGFDVAGGAVRVVVMDTASEAGGADGYLHRDDLTTSVKAELDAAEAAGKYTIVVSHHSGPTLTNGSGLSGPAAADAVQADELHTFLSGYPHLLMHLGAHTHLFRVTPIKPAMGHAYFEVDNASLADWPGEVRIFEIYDQGANIEIKATPLDYSVEGDPVTAQARERQAADYDSGWVEDTVGPGPEDSRTVELWLPKPTM